MTLQPKFYARSLSGEPLLPSTGIEFKVNSMRWGVWGGPLTANLSAIGDEKGLVDLFSKLRCPIEVIDEVGRVCWWGYVSSVHLKIGVLEVTVNIDSMSNRVAVIYSFIDADSDVIGSRKMTAWADDTVSQEIYGVKEFISSASGLSDAVAEAKRDTLLAALKLPESTTKMGSNSKASESVLATIECRGWWETLGWRYYPAGFPTTPAYITTAGSTTQNIGNTGGYMAIGQYFDPGPIPFFPESIDIYISKTGTPGNLVVKIEKITGSTVETYFAARHNTVSTSIGWLTCTPSAADRISYSKTISRIDGSTWRIVVKEFYPGTLDGNYYTVGVNEGLGYTDGAMYLLSGAYDLTQTARVPDADLLFKINSPTADCQDRVIASVIGLNSFLTGVQVESSATTDMSTFQDGESTLLDRIKELLVVGGENGRRLLCQIDSSRVARIFEEPVKTATHLLEKTGKLKTLFGGEIIPYMPPVGVYARLVDIVPGSVDSGLFTDPTLQFIESATWSQSRGLSLEFRGERMTGDVTEVDVDKPQASMSAKTIFDHLPPRIGI